MGFNTRPRIVEVALLARTIVALSLCAVLILPSTAFAANWVYLQRQEGTRYGPCTEYLDAESVVKSEDKVTYWTIWVLDEKQEDSTKKLLWKQEVPLSIPLQHRNLEMYQYNSEEVELRHYLQPMMFFSVSSHEVNRVRQYANIGNEQDTSKPDHRVTPLQRMNMFTN